MAAVSLLMRYMGLAVVAAVAAWALVQPAADVRERIRRVALAALPGALVALSWSLFLSAHGAPARHLYLDPAPLSSLRQIAGATLSWLAPDPTGREIGALRLARAALKLLLAAGLLWIIFREWRGASDTPRRTLRASALVVASLLGMLVAAQFLHRTVEYSDRVFSPLHALLDVGAVATLALWWRTTRRHGLAIAALAVWGLASASATADIVHEAVTTGFFHARRDVVGAPIWRWVRDSARTGSALYSNDVADVYFATHRPARSMPLVVNADTARALAMALGRQPSLIIWAPGYTETVLFPELRPIAATPERLEALLPLKRRAVFPQGIVWEYAP
jgi:hypothetical protein